MKRYVAHLSPTWSHEHGIALWTTSGDVTPCGQWVEQHFKYSASRAEVVRHRLDEHWHETQVAAFAAKAPQLRALGERLIAQAAELEAAARQEAAT